ncbi:hypothetical protein XENOCAPTIV_000989 [Xenoophorus captivus]|uniref:Uncharacterized protein n=1 Tax=Xenoophorus captivus TaxID=1517983 RepID=A0ABV0R7B4_9TELE
MLKLALVMWNVTSLGVKEPELVRKVERYWLEIVEVTSTHTGALEPSSPRQVGLPSTLEGPAGKFSMVCVLDDLQRYLTKPPGTGIITLHGPDGSFTLNEGQVGLSAVL